MKVPTKFVLKLNEDQIQQLKQLWQTGSSTRIRQRAHSILLSSKGYSIDEIVDILEVHRNSVSSWIQAWERAGISELSDKPRSGAPSQLKENDMKRLRQLVTEYPQSPKTILAKFAKATNKTISMSTLRRVVKQSRHRWKRTRKSLKSKRDPQQFALAAQEIQKLTQQQQAGQIDLFYFDESGFALASMVPYAYQPLGETIEIPASLSRKRFNVLGFFSPDNRLESFCFEVNIDSSIVVASFNEFCRQITKKTIVIIDNSSIHTSSEFIENLPKWESKNLLIKYLPPYSPELNLIEILWRFIKYKWLPLSAYLSFKTLVAAVEKVLKNVGSEWLINFTGIKPIS